MPTRAALATQRSRDTKVEDWLSDREIPYEFVTDVPVSEFNIEKGLHNQARTGHPVDEATVERYVEARKNGAIFPAVVAYREKSSGLLVAVDGNHRIISAQMTNQTLAVYVIEAATDVIVQLTFEGPNNQHGLPTSEEERRKQAQWMIGNGISITDAAARLNLKREIVAADKAKDDATQRAIEVGIPPRDWESMNKGVRDKLRTISSDEGFEAAAKLARSAGLNLTETKEMAEEMAKTRSAKQQVATVNAFRQVYADRIASGHGDTKPATGKRQRSPRAAFLSSLALVSVMPRSEVVVEQFKSVERDDQVKRIDEAIDRLRELRTAFTKATDD